MKKEGERQSKPLSCYIFCKQEFFPLQVFISHKLFVLNEVKCHAENADALKARLVDGSGPVTAIPAGFVDVDKPLVIDNTLLESLSVKKLWCEELVQIDAGVTAAMLDEHLEDNGGPGSTDLIGISLWNKNGTLLYSSSWDGNQTIKTAFIAGNLILK